MIIDFVLFPPLQSEEQLQTKRKAMRSLLQTDWRMAIRDVQGFHPLGGNAQNLETGGMSAHQSAL